MNMKSGFNLGRSSGKIVKPASSLKRKTLNNSLKSKSAIESTELSEPATPNHNHSQLLSQTVNGLSEPANNQQLCISTIDNLPAIALPYNVAKSDLETLKQ